MTTRVDEAIPQVRHREALNQQHEAQVAHEAQVTHESQVTHEVQAMRKERSEVVAFSEADPPRKPLVPFEATPARVAPPLTW